MSSSLALSLAYGLLPPVFDSSTREPAGGVVKSPETSLTNEQRNNKQRQRITTQPYLRQSNSNLWSDQQGSNKQKQLKFTEIRPVNKSKSTAINLYVSNTRLELLDKPGLAGIDIYV